MVNTVKLYGRAKVIDGHREPFGKLKVLLSRNDVPKLIIGTQVSNALVTTSIRLDQNLPPSVGAVTSNFNLTISDSFATKIFVDMESVTATKSIVIDPTTARVLNTGMLSHQLQQILTRFDLPSTIRAKLIKSVILSCIENATGKVEEVLENILALYDHGDNSPSILFNVALNRELESLVKLLMPSIISWNAFVARQIKQGIQRLA
ncbi:hypothetical protein G6F46_008016 [Rhizopus delemar]|uniref:Uncharacterized protein n=2 Tax=Rhizopus TaxID=4842 RepID=A0A9P6ZES9_9FUNG|nr:hypothetical protein G6F36_013224 [Rhizopus arrhizus]KAG1452919.1 hypothetical protein G6F55_008413 [Rhizopus delemar]KAG1496646.1 hypothetical protein G6F54_006325 [Rhizopus delemar]KAG1510400.1 hypothetical protein G6F53_006716 [Rhizopus delemar]KAG1521583.1 hypothetical protein G6F52_006616 [Rhizopus delemar]